MILVIDTDDHDDLKAYCLNIFIKPDFLVGTRCIVQLARLYSSSGYVFSGKSRTNRPYSSFHVFGKKYHRVAIMRFRAPTHTTYYCNDVECR